MLGTTFFLPALIFIYIIYLKKKKRVFGAKYCAEIIGPVLKVVAKRILMC
jgi:F0F1-type ATP synthase assembly protein I